MANEFIARRGIIVLQSGATITGSSAISGALSVVGGVVSASGFSGSGAGLTNIVADSVQFDNVLNKPTLVSASSQINGASITNNSVSYTAGAGLSGGGSATLGGSAVTIDAVAGAGVSLTSPTNDAININTGSAHFVTGSRGTISSANTTGASGINLTYNTASGIISGSLVNSSVTVNGQSISLGGTGTVTANTTNALTLGAGLTGTSFNGSTAVTTTVDTGSTHFTNGVTTRLNALGVISSSAQVAINSTTGTLNVNRGGTGQTSYVNGELLIGNTTGNTLTKATLTQGNGMTITNGAGSITLAIDTGSTHFTSGVKTKLNTDGVVSSSGQINGASITNNSVSYTAGAGLSGGGSATLGGGAVAIDVVAGAGISVTTPTNDAVNIDTGSGHFVSGSRKAISSVNTTGASGINLTYNNATGVISGSLVNSSVTVNGQAISLGGSGTVTANTTNTLTFGAGLTGTSFNGSTAVTTTVDTSSAHFTNGVKTKLNADGVFSSSAQVSYTGLSNVPANIVSSSTQVTAFLPAGTVSASSQVDHNATTNYVSNQHIDHSTVNISAGSGLTGGGNITTTRTLTLDTGSAHFTNGVKTKLNADGVFSSSAQVNASQVTGIGAYATTASNTFTGIQTLSNTTQSTNFTNGALVVTGGAGIGGNLNVSGSVNISGVLTVVSMSTQYVTSSQYTVGTSRIIVNDDDNVRFAGLSVNDSGSTTATGSLLWDSLRDRFIYDTNETAGGGVAHSAILVTGPESYGGLGNEIELVVGRIPVATTDHNLDNRIASSSIRMDFPTKLTHIEAGLQVTGSVSSSVGFSGNGAGLTNVTAASVAFANVTSKPTLVSASSQIDHNSTTNYVANRHIDHTAVNISAGNGLTGGGDISATRTLTLDTGSAHFTNGVKTKLNADGVFSSSAQVSYTGLSNIPANIVSSSTQFTNPSAPFTGSFSGSFFGNGAGLTGLATTLSISGSTSGTGTINLLTQGLIVSGTNGIASTVSGQTVTLAGVDATTTTKGVASFNSTNFTVTNGAVTSNNISINGTNVTLGGTRNITLQEITTQGASTSTATTFSNSATINNTFHSGSVVSSIVGPVSNQVVASFATASFDAVHFDYVVKDGTNFRTGTVMAVKNGTGTVEFTDTSTADIGNTLGVNFEVDTSGGNFRLKFSATTGTWTVKTAIRAL
jgi:hypothetical protein